MPLKGYKAHKTLHQDAGSDEISVAGLGGVLTDDQHIIDLEAVDAMGAKADANPLNHDRYTDALAVIAAKTVKLDAFTAPDDGTTLDASNARHGLLKKLIDDTTKFLRSDGGWQVPAGGGPTTALKSADQSVKNSTTLVNANDMLFAVGANEIWEFWIQIGWTRELGGAQAPKYAFSIPLGGNLLTSSAVSGTSLVAPTDGTSSKTLISVASTERWHIFKGRYFGGANGGNIQLQFAQETSENYNHTMKIYSHMVAHQLA